MTRLQFSRRQMLSTLSILSLGGITKAFANVPNKKVTFVFVHGAWHGGWCWNKIIQPLKSAGHQVFTPTMTGLGERSHLLTTQVDLNTHIQDVVNVLEYEDLNDVMLVGHSYAGMVISGVAEKAAKRLSQLIYLDAYLPESGKSVNDYNKAKAPSPEVERTNRLPVWGNPQIYGVTNKDDIIWMSSRLGDQPYKTFTQSLQLTEDTDKHLKKTFIQLTEFPQFIEAAERARSKGFGYYKLLSGGHDAMISKPKELRDILLKFI
jgi:pimeloyl-ACP methyl ester carboxylesterase